MNCGQIQQGRGVYLTQNFDISKEFDIENLFTGELIGTNECRTLNFSNSVTFVDRRKKGEDHRKTQNKLNCEPLNGIFVRTVFHETSKSRSYSQNMYFWKKYLPFTEIQNSFIQFYPRKISLLTPKYCISAHRQQ